MRRIATWAAATIMVLCATAPAGAEIAPQKVIDEPGNQQFSPSGNGAWFAFTANSDAHPNRFDAYAQMIDGSARTRLNPKGTDGNAGNFDPGTDTVIFSQYSDTARSNLRRIYSSNPSGSRRAVGPLFCEDCLAQRIGSKHQPSAASP